MTNMVTPADVATDEEYRDLCGEIAEELQKYGQLVAMYIPRNTGSPIFGRVYVEYADVSQAAAAARVTAGRIFGGRAITVDYEDGIPVGM